MAHLWGFVPEQGQHPWDRGVHSALLLQLEVLGKARAVAGMLVTGWAADGPVVSLQVCACSTRCPVPAGSDGGGLSVSQSNAPWCKTAFCGAEG